MGRGCLIFALAILAIFAGAFAVFYVWAWPWIERPVVDEAAIESELVEFKALAKTWTQRDREDRVKLGALLAKTRSDVDTSLNELLYDLDNDYSACSEFPLDVCGEEALDSPSLQFYRVMQRLCRQRQDGIDEIVSDGLNLWLDVTRIDRNDLYDKHRIKLRALVNSIAISAVLDIHGSGDFDTAFTRVQQILAIGDGLRVAPDPVNMSLAVTADKTMNALLIYLLPKFSIAQVAAIDKALSDRRRLVEHGFDTAKAEIVFGDAAIAMVFAESAYPKDVNLPDIKWIPPNVLKWYLERERIVYLDYSLKRLHLFERWGAGEMNAMPPVAKRPLSITTDLLSFELNPFFLKLVGQDKQNITVKRAIRAELQRRAGGGSGFVEVPFDKATKIVIDETRGCFVSVQ
jgi:hypothetical protein